MLLYKTHSSIWYSNPRNYKSLVSEDTVIRNFFFENLQNVGLNSVDIKRKLGFIFINLFVLKPNMILSLSSSNLTDLRKDLSSLLYNRFNKSEREIVINIVEVINPDTNPKVLANLVVQQLEKRVPFRRIMRSVIVKAQKAGVKGIKVQIAGRLNGAEIARTEWVREGKMPLHTLSANINFSSCKAL